MLIPGTAQLNFYFDRPVAAVLRGLHELGDSAALYYGPFCCD
jgi:hypothetical protein